MARLVDRRNKTVVKRCPTCRRDGWAKVITPSLLTEAEQQDMFGHVKRLTDDLTIENCWAGSGCSIYDTVAEAVSLSFDLDKRIVFEFNEILVYVDKWSNIKKVVDDWWFKAYGNTPEESMRDR